ncbi:hypothetical protein MKW94_010329 [Papaver nudicaule]|uniref:Cytochrome P450 n=1 Tax=Papaver nudicaule TaxID=74823 RepID=A0AA41VNY6_PAPNU|nr:hypothetical protein [Papaver nudicaule]
MDFVPFQFSTTTTTLLLTLAAVLLSFAYSTISNIKWSKAKQPPELACSWPLIGHLHLLGGKDQLLFRSLGDMADKYGAAFTIRLGLRRALVISNWEVAKECFTFNDKIFMSRPLTVALKYMGYDNLVFGFAPYGPYWQELRKIVHCEFLSHSKLECLKHVWDSEIKTSIEELYNKQCLNVKSSVDMKQWLMNLTLNISLKLIVGKRYLGNSSASDDEVDRATRCQQGVREFFRLARFVPSDGLPCLRWLDLGGYERDMKKTGRELDAVLQGWLEEHKLNKKISSLPSEQGYENKDTGEQDFMDVMLSILDDKEVHTKISASVDADTIIKSTCLTLILGRTDTVMVGLLWALSLLVNHPHVLEKAEAELIKYVGRERQVEESDIKKLVYLQAIIKETMRLYPPGPLSAPRESMSDCTIAGYHVPAGTRLIVNIWKVQRDPQVWSEPEEFRPERFLSAEHLNTAIGPQDFKLMPFGSGRRICPARDFSLQIVHLTLARLIHGFKFKAPSDAPIDMTESSGLNNVKGTPLEVLITPTLSTNLYHSG